MEKLERTVYVRNEADFWVCEAGAQKGETLTLTQFYGKYPFPKTHEYYAPRPGVLEVYLRGTYREKPTTGKTAKAAKPEPTPAPAVKAPEKKGVATTAPRPVLRRSANRTRFLVLKLHKPCEAVAQQLNKVYKNIGQR